MKKLEGKTIIITGGSTGIGLAVSKKIAEEGGTVVMCARNEKNLEVAIEQIEEISKTEHFYFVMNVSKRKQVQFFMEWCKEKFKHIDGLVNCAGVYGPIGETPTVDMIEFNDTIKINLMGTIYMCNMFSTLYNSKKQKIVNFAGGGAASPFPNYSAYATSKVAIVRFTENLSLELGENFDINCIAPGFVNTRIHQKTLDAGSESAGKAFYENTKKQLETGATPPEKAADLTAFLLSDESNGITGKFISAPWDPWKEQSFQELLKTDKDFATIRRIDNKTFYKK